MTTEERSALVGRLRESARAHSAASKMLADAKTARNCAAEGEPVVEGQGYTWQSPEQTIEWRAADLLEQDGRKLEEAVAAEREACAHLADDRFRESGWNGHFSQAAEMVASDIRSRSSLSKDKRAG